MNIKKGLMVGVAALGLSLSSQADEINVGGVVWDPDSLFDLTIGSNLVEDQLDLGNGIVELRGAGLVSQLNGANSSVFCPGCELTFTFGGYMFDQAQANAGDPTNTDIGFTGGWINFYIDHTPDYDPVGDSLATAGDEGGANALFLRMEGHEIAVPAFGGDLLTLAATLSSFGAGTDAGLGKGLLDATGGLAFGNFDTNGQADGADWVFTSSFQPIPNGGANGNGFELFGTADFSGDSIPEPTSIALLGLGLLGFAASRKKKA